MTQTTILDDRAVSEIEARANRATPPPWECGPTYRFIGAKNAAQHPLGGSAICNPNDNGGTRLYTTNRKNNGEFIAHAREDIPALCATVKHLRAERLEIQRALASSVLNDPTEDDDPPYSTTELVEGVRFVLKMKEAKAARTKELQSQLEQLRAENEALRKWQRDVEEREAAVCPEDVPFDEYIWALKKRAAQAREDRDELSTEMETCHSLLDQFYAKDPAMTSLDTLEKRLKLHLDELRPVITDGDVNGDD